MAAAVTEAQMEKKLIEQLTQGANQWRLREDLKTIPQLWANFSKFWKITIAINCMMFP